jgi:hypothetical protein
VTESPSNLPSVKQPSAFLPLAMSLAALALLLVHYAVYGDAHQPDEGADAHIFQLLLVLQLPMVAFFAIKWLPQAPQAALRILALQAGAGIAAIATVFFLEQ